MSGEAVQKQKQTGVVRMERVFRHSPEAIWRALTDPKALSQWLLPNDFRAELGHRFRFRQRSDRGHMVRIDCRVIELDAPHRLAYLWHSEEESLPTLVTWTLEPVEGGTSLHVEHVNPNGIQNSTTSASQSISLFIDRSLQHIGQVAEVVDESSSTSLRAAIQPGRIVLSKSHASIHCIGRPIIRVHATHTDQTQKLVCKEVNLCTR